MPLQIVDPAILSSIAHLELIARHAVEGTVSGLHHSRFIGRNVEFSEHRPYNPGDELRHIDWRAFAKTDRFHVKIFEEDTNLRALILTDLSRSMLFGESTVTKLQYSQQMTAALSYLMLSQGDSVGLAVFDEKIRSYIPPRNREDQWGAMMQIMLGTEINKETSAIAGVLSDLGEHLKKRGIVILISDLIDDPEAVLKNLSFIGKHQQEMIVFHVLTPEELDLPYQGTVDFHALEGADDSLMTAPKRLRAAYREKVKRFIDTYRGGCLERGIDYTLVPTDQPIEGVLREYLQHRLKSVNRI